ISAGLATDPNPKTGYTYPGGTPSLLGDDYYFEPAINNPAPVKHSPAITSTGYGWMYPNLFNYDIAPGDWTFSNRYEGSLGSVNGSLAIYAEAAVYSWDPIGGDVFLFAATSPLNVYSSFSPV